ncbi:hypothetical protein ACH9DO_05155 [Kocuria sp. M1N1S27]|uniref:hypothetical protein n=1 Tax=Kocuria kalidii TaxID=3376283 RepID=UPI0037AAE903
MGKDFKMSKAQERRLEKSVQKELDLRMEKAAKRHPIQPGDSEVEIARKLSKQLTDAGVEPNQRSVREQAREIAKRNSQG